MAEAPIPGGLRRAEEAEQAERVAYLTVDGETVHLAVANVPMREKTVVLRETGITYENFFGMGGRMAVGEASLLIVWWLGRRAAGEADLPYQQVCDEWDKLDPEKIEFGYLDPGDMSSPEVSGPGSTEPGLT